MQRKLTVILSADIVGYSSLMERDESGTLARLKANRASLFDPRVGAHGGRIFKLMGDGALIEFSSAASAVTCALEIQEAMEKAEAGIDETKRLRYRIGINLGDVIIDGDDIYGDGVNVAARLQALAPVGGVALARSVSDQVAGKIEADIEDLGEHSVKNIERPIHVFAARPKSAGGAKHTAAADAKPRLSICVLPFINMSGDPEQEYFSDGISEDIITDLSKVSALWVAARNTAFTFKGKHVDVPQVARQLKVSHVLEGSVRKSGARVRITAQLIDAGGGHVWAERYDRNLDDIFALQDEISEAIVKALKVRLMPEEKKAIEMRGTSSAKAYTYYLLARQFYAGGNSNERIYQAVIRLCRRAVELDPGYALAWVMIARMQEQLNFHGGVDACGLEAAERAVALDPKLGVAHAALGRVYDRLKRKAEAEREIELALALDPDSPEVSKVVAAHFFTLGRLREAAPFYERASETEETNCSSPGMLTTVYEALGDKEGARRAAQLVVERGSRIVATDPANSTIISWLVTGLGVLGDHERAREWIERAMILEPDDFNMAYNFACTLIRNMGDHDAGLALLEKTLNIVQQASLDWIKVDPDLDPVREDLRFKAMVAAAEERLAPG